MTYVANDRVEVLTFDGRPVYAGTVTSDAAPTGRVPVRNDETGETVAVPVGFVRPEDHS